MMESDFYTFPIQPGSISNKPLIGEDCIIAHAIIDKNVCRGNNVWLINTDK